MRSPAKFQGLSHFCFEGRPGPLDRKVAISCVSRANDFGGISGNQAMIRNRFLDHGAGYHLGISGTREPRHACHW
jgi:hypothetical protein